MHHFLKFTNYSSFKIPSESVLKSGIITSNLSFIKYLVFFPANRTKELIIFEGKLAISVSIMTGDSFRGSKSSVKIFKLKKTI
jgi:uncharacterized protein (DUF486 family)